MNTRLRFVGHVLIVLSLIILVESVAQAATSWGMQPTWKHNVYVVLSGKFGTFLMVMSGAAGVVCLLLSGGADGRNHAMVAWGFGLLLAAAALVGLRMLVATGTMEYLEIRDSYHEKYRD